MIPVYTSRVIYKIFTNQSISTVSVSLNYFIQFVKGLQFQEKLITLR